MNFLRASQKLAITADLSKLDAVGGELLHTGQSVGYWVVVIVSVFQIIKAAASGDKHKVGEILLMGILVYGALFIVPYALDLVSGVF